jgi:hypothetical protein
MLILLIWKSSVSCKFLQAITHEPTAKRFYRRSLKSPKLQSLTLT